MASTDRGRRPGGVAGALAVLIAIGAVLAIGLGVGASSPSHPARLASSSTATTTVQRRDLVATDTEPGTLSYAGSHTVFNRLSGTITWLPAVGAVIGPGRALFAVAGQPVTLMNGRAPAYRDLGPSDSSGPDILELNRNLVALGFNAAATLVNDRWQAATTDGVDLLQASLGESETGTLKLGSVVFLPGRQVVSTVSAQLGAQAALRVPDPQRAFASLTTTTHTNSPTGANSPRSKPRATPHHALHSGPPITLAALLALLKAETAQLAGVEAQVQAMKAQLHAAQTNPTLNPAGSASAGGASPSSGSGAGTGTGGSATAVLTTSSTQIVVTVGLNPSKQSEATVGEPVTVEMPSGDTVKGRISTVSAVALASAAANTGAGDGGGANANPGSGTSTTIPVTITLSGAQPRPGLDQASVSVNFAQAKANGVLSVPVTALLAVQGGGYAVQEAASPQRLLPVRAGLFAAGYVQISGPGITPGLEVTDSQG